MSAAGGDEDGVIREAIHDAVMVGAVKIGRAVPHVERNIPHADGSRECHPVARAAVDPVDAALARYEEAKRWRAEAKAGIDRAVHDFGVALVKEEQARVRYFDALDGREAG
jgi:hypothetical protein